MTLFAQACARVLALVNKRLRLRAHDGNMSEKTLVNNKQYPNAYGSEAN